MQEFNPNGSILLLSADASLERLISAEAYALQLSLRVAHTAASALSLPGDILLILWDVDSVPGISEVILSSHAVFGFTRKEDALPPEQLQLLSRLWHRPFPVDQLRTDILHYIRTGRAAPTPARKTSAPRALPIALEPDGLTLRVDEQRIALTEKEAIVMSCLLEQRGEIVTREMLRAALDNGNEGEDSNKTDVYVCFLRRKLEHPLGLRLITTVRGKGYRLELTDPRRS